MEFLFEYGLFFAKVATGVVAFVIIVSVIFSASQKNKQSPERGHLEITPLNQQFEHLKETMLLATVDESLQKAEEKNSIKPRKNNYRMRRKHQRKIQILLVKQKAKSTCLVLMEISALVRWDICAKKLQLF